MFKSINLFKNYWYPERYHGQNVDHNFFEGWYYKIEGADGDSVFAFIAGVSKNLNGEKIAFIQTVDGVTHQTNYFKFSYDDFYAATDRFYIRIGENEFSKDHLELNLPNLKAELYFTHHISWEKSIFTPNIMGVLSYYPFLECNHGIVSIRNEVNGYIVNDYQCIKYKEGRGYLEKDWGSSFPKAHIWIQSNRFEKSNSSLSVAIAKMPFAGTLITGFAAILVIEGEQLLFSSYNFSKLHILKSNDSFEFEFKSRAFRLELKPVIKDYTTLVAPNSSGMNGRVKESLNSLVRLNLISLDSGETVFSDSAINVGIEIAGTWN